jgi:hypothetical protein
VVAALSLGGKARLAQRKSTKNKLMTIYHLALRGVDDHKAGVIKLVDDLRRLILCLSPPTGGDKHTPIGGCDRVVFDIEFI